MQAVKQFSSLLGMGQDSRLETLKEAMGVLQHHDAVSGTAKQAVTDDYYERLSNGMGEAFKLVAEAYSKLQPSVPGIETDINPIFCPLLNESSCPPTETHSSFIVTLYNPLGKSRKQYPVRIPVPGDTGFTVTDFQDNVVLSQLVPIPKSVLQLPGRVSSATYELVFFADEIPPLGYTQFHVQRTANRRVLKRQMSSVTTPADSENDLHVNIKDSLSLYFDEKTKLLSGIGVEKHGDITTLKVNQTYLWYAGMNGHNTKESDRASGAYIFRPNGTSPYTIGEMVNISIIEGDVVTEIHQEWSSWMSQVMRIYNQEPLKIEMEWLVGPIPIGDGIGKEVINRVIWGEVSTSDTFYTDSNGREILKRVKDSRETWHLLNQEPVAGNYYPVNSRLMIHTDNDFTAALFNDRSQGGTSLQDGHMELMIHRRLLHDDAFGVGEALNETAFGKGLVARGKHYLIFSDLVTPDCDFGCQHRTLGEQLMLQPILSFNPSTDSTQAWKNTLNTQWSGLKHPLPENVHLLTLEPWLNGTLLLRLEHMYEKQESEHLSSPVTVDLEGLFSDLEILSAEEMTLAANLLKKDESRYQWNVGSHPSMNHIDRVKELRDEAEGAGDDDDDDSNTLLVTLNPMEIRTFVLTVKKTTLRY